MCQGKYPAFGAEVGLIVAVKIINKQPYVAIQWYKTAEFSVKHSKHYFIVSLSNAFFHLIDNKTSLKVPL